ncbi:peroxidase, partial [Schumannella luteola]
CVMRRFRLDVDGFRALAPADRDATIGRVQSTGAPLSGGARDDQVNLGAKAADGTLLIPPHAHARAAHPSFTGSPLMLRRSYSYRVDEADHGHVFISYQNDVQTFARTQLRLDEVDALMRFSTPTATAAFAILPGISGDA